ncbi:ureidoglycolate lyase [Saccharospirillum salsuginis]|uniref:Ureidoglycolate lyase n=2 Tax=Saccharospirillum salsuginis TaxID=418750 RepID=A0A918N890_9GAMM|nr:ureidoglycolate lyase [Saccharospirillum salsuginis]
MTMQINLQPQPLTRDNFKAFGDVIETADRDYFMINDGNTRRYHRLAEVDTGPADGKPIINIFRSGAYDYPFRIRMLERHPHGSQAFIPLHGEPFLIVVAPRADRPDPNAIQAFIARGDQGVNYHRATWHHPVLALKDQDEFLVVDRAGDLPNCDEHFFPEDLQITLQPANT